MGSYSCDDQIPVLNLPKEGLMGLISEEYWKDISKKMREACEKQGCFVLKCEEILGGSTGTHEETFMAAKALFDLPEETKRKHRSVKPYRSYDGNCPVIPLSESFGIDNGGSLQAVQAFTSLMWPQGNNSFW
ncbi:Non-heme dioxygenase N-terminal domain containing protein [Parasponia andersonii]|uniref:Non-heme dioxygenase N-terminal domain containing protein n=1 Tax=Parasponia andersonii TaxID=3476 RepID=A0A2P5CAD4_PARAD|nr:Non-heme dioxygenase N-terminal domain containing protein [Parasponia andersonii]